MRAGFWVLGVELVAIAVNDEPAMVATERDNVACQTELSPTMGFETRPWRHTESVEPGDTVPPAMRATDSRARSRRRTDTDFR